MHYTFSLLIFILQPLLIPLVPIIGAALAGSATTALAGAVAGAVVLATLPEPKRTELQLLELEWVDNEEDLAKLEANTRALEENTRKWEKAIAAEMDKFEDNRQQLKKFIDQQSHSQEPPPQHPKEPQHTTQPIPER